MAIKPQQSIAWSTSKFWCSGCQRPLRYEFLSSDKAMCVECFAELERHRMDTALASIPQAISQLRPALRPKVQTGPIISRLLQKMAGEELGDRYAEKLQEVLSDPEVSFREVRQWLNGALRLVQRQEQLDKDQATPFGNMSDAELKDILRPACIEMMKSDPDFFSEVMALSRHVITTTANEVSEQTDPSE